MSSLIKLLVVANAVDAHLFKELLEQEGIAAVIRGDDMLPLQGGHLFRMEVRPSVRVLDDERLPRAREMAAEQPHPVVHYLAKSAAALALLRISATVAAHQHRVGLPPHTRSGFFFIAI